MRNRTRGRAASEREARVPAWVMIVALFLLRAGYRSTWDDNRNALSVYEISRGSRKRKLVLKHERERAAKIR